MALAGRVMSCPGPLPKIASLGGGGRTVQLRPCRHVSCRAVTGQASGVSQAARVKDASQLKDPAHIGARGHRRASVQDMDGAGSLATYMTLPVEQYFVLDPSMIKPLGGDRFRLQVPPLSILNVTLRPVAEIRVTTSRDSVFLETTNCQLFGDALIESLNDKFCMRFVTTLTWASASYGNGGAAGGRQIGGGGASAADAPGVPGSIQAEGELDVWCEVVPPFNLLPRAALEGACNVVMRALLDSLLPIFVSQLASDYERWSKDPAYRELRAARSMPLA